MKLTTEQIKALLIEEGFVAEELDEVIKAKTAVSTPEGGKLKIGDTRHVADAITALSPSGFRGHQVQLTPDERKTAIAAIRHKIESMADGEQKQHLLDRLNALEHGKALGNLVIKSVDGKLRWTQIVTNNAYDREGQAVSASGLEQIVQKSRAQDFYPPLEFFHFEYPIGKADYYGVVNGHLVASGGINDDAPSHAIAKFIQEHPEGVDGSGWGSSWRFFSNPDSEGVFKTITRIKEFTVLPMSQAANPYTDSEVTKMQITEEMRKALDVVLPNPELRAIVLKAQEADDQAKSLDEQGVQRKDVAVDASAQTLHGPGGVVSDPGQENGKASEKCKACGHAAHGTEQCKAENCKCMGQAKAMDTESDSDTDDQSKAIEDRPLRMKDLKDVYDFFQAEQQKAVDAKAEEMTKAINAALAPLAEAFEHVIQRLEVVEGQEKAIQETHVQPRGTLEYLKSISASRSAATVVDKDSELAKSKPAETAGNEDRFSQVGLKSGK